MQRAVLPQATFTHIQHQVSPVQPGHVTDPENRVVNDDSYRPEISRLRMVISVLANVIGGTILLAGMFVLPQLIAGILG